MDAPSRGVDTASPVALTFRPPHVVRAPDAQLSRELEASVDARMIADPPTNVDAAIEQALSHSSQLLHFGLDHRTSMRFDEGDREGNCIEYAHVFATVLNRIARARSLDAHAYVVRSGDARVLGMRVPLRGFADHDWAIVTARAGTPLAFIDPSLADAGFRANVRENVIGSVAVPVRRAPRARHRE